MQAQVPHGHRRCLVGGTRRRDGALGFLGRSDSGFWSGFLWSIVGFVVGSLVGIAVAGRVVPARSEDEAFADLGDRRRDGGHAMKWLLLVLAFVLGAVITWFLTVRRASRTVQAGPGEGASPAGGRASRRRRGG